MRMFWRCVLGEHDWGQWELIMDGNGGYIEYSGCRRLGCTASRSVTVSRNIV